MKFEHTQVFNFDGALRGMRNPMNSWDKSDNSLSVYNVYEGDVMPADLLQSVPDAYITEQHYNIRGRLMSYKPIIIGDNDMELAQKLIRAGSEHRKFLRQIFVSVDITAPLFWWKEFDTYKVGTVRNSCSTMHKIHVKPFEESDFTHHGIDAVGGLAKDALTCLLRTLEYLRIEFNKTHEKKYWRAIIELLPDSYNMRATVTLNYENLLGMCSKGQRRFHKQNEWSGMDCYEDENFIAWARQLPYAQQFIFIDELDGDNNGKN